MKGYSSVGRASPDKRVKVGGSNLPILFVFRIKICLYYERKGELKMNKFLLGVLIGFGVGELFNKWEKKVANKN